LGIDTHQGHSLKISPIVARRFGAGFGELIGYILRGQVSAALADAAPLQQVAGEILHVFADSRGGDGGILGQRQQGDQGQKAKSKHGEMLSL
jgi:hypothetical protein